MFVVRRGRNVDSEHSGMAQDDKQRDLKGWGGKSLQERDVISGLVAAMTGELC